MRALLPLLVCAAVACLHAAKPTPDITPEQVHIAFAGADAQDGHPTGMRVAWYTTAMPTTAVQSAVQYGLAPTALNQTATAAKPAVQYLAKEGYHHVCLVDGVPPATQVYYRVGSPDSWSETFSFVSAPAAAAAATTDFAISIFGDMGWLDSTQRPMILAVAGLKKHWSATVSRTRMEALKNSGAIDWVWHLGDIGYVDDAFAHHPLGFHYEIAYNGYMQWLQNLTAAMPYMVSPGNHESECHSPGCISERSRALALSNFSAYNNRWHMPSKESGGRANSAMWHSWNYGPVHFVSINTETDWVGAEEQGTGDSHDKKLPAGYFGADGEYLRWLEADLKKASDARARARAGQGAGAWAPAFIVAGGHRPYGDIKGKHTLLFKKYGVDMYLAGHGHSYSRGAAVDGTTYIMAGGAGCDEMTYVEDAGVAEQMYAPGWAVPPGSEEVTSGRVATGVLRANATSLHFQLIDSADGSTIDSVVVAKADQDRDRDSRAL